MVLCCICNRKHGICKRCFCVQSGRPCVSCLPLRERHCINMLQHHQHPCGGSHGGEVSNNSNSQLDGDHTSSDSVTVSDVDTSSQVPNNNIDSNCASFDVNSFPVDCDSLMKKTYGATLIQSGSCSNTPWH